MPRPRDPLLFAETFLKATFPELAGNATYFEVAGFGFWGSSPFRFQQVRVVAQSSPGVKIDGAETYAQVPLVAHLSLISQDGVDGVEIMGRLVHADENAAVERVVRERRDWTEANVHEELRRRGARFTRGVDEVLNALPLKAWIPLFGELRLVEAELSTPGAGTDQLERGDNFVTTWQLVLENRPQRRRYLVHAEPFGARVTRFGFVVWGFTLR